MLSITD